MMLEIKLQEAECPGGGKKLSFAASDLFKADYGSICPDTKDDVSFHYCYVPTSRAVAWENQAVPSFF